MSFPTPRMPPELLRHVVENLGKDRKSLCSVSLASRTLREEGQRMLFRDVTSCDKADTHLKFLHAITSSPSRLALFVHAYSNFLLGPLSGDPHSHELTRNALQKMHKLKHLTLRPSHRYQSSWMLSECTFSLESFHLCDTQDIEWIVESFIPQQVKLRHLHMPWIDTYTLDGTKRQLPAPPAPCSQLVTLSGSWATIALLLPGNNVRSLRWYPDSSATLDHATIAPLVDALKNIEAFSVRSSRSLDYYDAVFEYCKSCTTLELGSQLSNLWQEIDVISKLPALRTLIFSKSPGNRLDVHAEDITFIFEYVSDSVEYIEVQTSPGTYTRHTRSGSTVENVSYFEVRRFWLLP